MKFSNLYFALLLIGLPFIYNYVIRQKPPTIPHPDLIAKLKDKLPNQTFKTRLPLYLRIITLGLLILCLMRPQLGYLADFSSRNGVDIMVALDISSSMLAEDFRPNRVTAAKSVLENFIKGRPNDRIGLVVFGSKSYVQCPLTIDHDTMLNYLNQVNVGLAEDGTAIGMALGNSVNRLKTSTAKSKVILLLTDGDNNAGEIDPETAAKLAAAMGIKIYAVGIGNPEGAPVKVKDQFGNEVYARNPDGSLYLTKMNEAGLKLITSKTAGEYFIASDIGKLNSVFDKINQLEKTEFKNKDNYIFEERYFWFALPALFFLFAEYFISRLYLRRIP